MIYRVAAPFLAVVALCWSTACPGATPRPAERRDSLRANPPRMRSLDVQPLDENTVRVMIEYGPDPRLGPRLTLNLAKGAVTFSRRADGRYVGDVPFTAAHRKALEERDRRIARLGSEARHFIYDDRVKVGSITAMPLNLARAGRASAARDTAAPVVSVPQAYLAVGALVPGPEDVLLITDRTVVADVDRAWDPCDPTKGKKGGVWTFAHLMRRLAGASDAATFTKEWLDQWTTDQIVDGLAVPLRPLLQTEVLDKWPTVGTTGGLDLDQAPVRLLAIINRIDLAENLIFGTGVGSGGELRFVFDVAPWQRTTAGTGECAVKKFQIIFEYEISATGCADVQEWAERWIALGQLPRGSPAFNLALEKITEEVVNGAKGQLAQVRTNEIDLGKSGSGGQSTLWEMREFALAGGKLKQRRVRLTPLDAANKTEAVSTYVNANAADIRIQVHELSAALPAGANPQMAGPEFWDGAHAAGQEEITDAQARFAFSLNTCNGCHARETCTKFNHVIGGGPGKEAGLSQFLTGRFVPDPVLCPAQDCSSTPTFAPTPAATPTPVAGAVAAPTPIDNCWREFNDLERRRQVLDELTLCVPPNDFETLNSSD